MLYPVQFIHRKLNSYICRYKLHLCIDIYDRKLNCSRDHFFLRKTNLIYNVFLSNVFYMKGNLMEK